MDIKLIPTEELINDLLNSRIDIGVCKTALEVGITVYSGGSVASRMIVNEKMCVMIEAELKRRNVCVESTESSTVLEVAPTTENSLLLTE